MKFLRDFCAETEATLARALLAKLPPGKAVGWHFYRGSYYQATVRYHLAILNKGATQTASLVSCAVAIRILVLFRQAGHAEPVFGYLSVAWEHRKHLPVLRQSIVGGERPQARESHASLLHIAKRCIGDNEIPYCWLVICVQVQRFLRPLSGASEVRGKNPTRRKRAADNWHPEIVGS
jgi:hypothetical protein